MEDRSDGQQRRVLPCRRTRQPGVNGHRIPDRRQRPEGVRRESGPTVGSRVRPLRPCRGVSRPPGEWNSLRIVAQGRDVEHWLNGHKVAAFEIGKRRLQAARCREVPRQGRLCRGPARTDRLAGPRQQGAVPERADSSPGLRRPEGTRQCCVAESSERSRSIPAGIDAAVATHAKRRAWLLRWAGVRPLT